jgi:hypothetical protein
MVDIPAKTCPKWEKFSQTKEKVMTEVREKQCIKCKQTKPSKEFKRRLSLAQSRAVLRNPNITTNYMADSKMCKDCQPKRKPPRKLTVKEIRTRLSNKDMHHITGELLLEKKREQIIQGRSRVMKQYWEDKKNEPIAKLKRHLQDQLNRFGNRHFASKNLQQATQEQNSWNYAEAKRIKNYLLDRAQSGHYVDPTIQIAPLIKPQPTKE